MRQIPVVLFLLASLALFFLHDGPLVIAGLFITQLSLQMSMTRTGKEVFGVIFNIQSWRNSGASQQTYFFRWYIGFRFPACYIFFLLLIMCTFQAICIISLLQAVLMT
jgi:restriction system protein